MESDDLRAQYLASESGAGGQDNERLDLIRHVLGEEASWAEPPPQVVDGLLAAIREKAMVTEVEAPVPAEKARWPGLVAAVGTVAAVVALVVSTVNVLDRDDFGTVVAMSGTDLEPSAIGTAAVRPTGSGWGISLDVSGLPPAPDGSYYEGWVWSDDRMGVSIGTFHLRDGGQPILLWSGVALADYPSIWVTLQEESGGPEASDLVVMTGRVTDLGEG